MTTPNEPRPTAESSLVQGGAASSESKRDGETRPAAGSRTEMPATLGRYRVLKKLGGGGMGMVYLVENTELQREEALKVPHFNGNDDPKVRERFLREARSAAKLDHPNLCQVYDVGVLDGIYFLTMRYLKGKPLSDYAGQPQPQRKAVEIVAKLAQALEAAHAMGVIHRDLKPNNIILCAGTGPTVMDFGLAKQFRQKNEKLTQLGTMLGTPSYMPPEQVKGELDRMGPASDVYSLGVILFELLTGRVPHQGAMAEVLGKILYAEAPSVSALRPGLNLQLDAICRKAMAKDTAERYPSMKGFAAILLNFLKTTPPTEGAGPLVLPAVGAPKGVFHANTIAPLGAPTDGSKGSKADNVFQANTVAPPSKPENGPGKARSAGILQANTIAPVPVPASSLPTPSQVSNAARPARTKPRSPVAADEEESGSRSLNRVLVWSLLILLLVGGGVGLFAWQHDRTKQKKSTTVDVAASTPPSAPNKTELPEPRPVVETAVRDVVGPDQETKKTDPETKKTGPETKKTGPEDVLKEIEEVLALLAGGKKLPELVAQREPGRVLAWKAAAVSSGQAQLLVGLCYLQGAGIAKAETVGAEWIRKSALTGPEAHYWLGRCYEDGTGVPQDLAVAMTWYEKAVGQVPTNNVAQTALDRLILARSKRSDPERQFLATAMKGDKEAQYKLGLAYYEGRRDLERDFKQAFEWFRRATGQGQAGAMAMQGVCYLNGEGVVKDVSEGFKLLQRSAPTSENPRAWAQLGLCYLRGWGVEVDAKKAIPYLQLAADANDATGQYLLGECYVNGKGVEHSPAEAVKWWTKAANQGHAAAQENLGSCYETGFGVKQDFVDAARLYSLAADQNWAGAMYLLGNCYADANGVAKDHSRALELWTKAADQGFIDARSALECYRDAGNKILPGSERQYYQEGGNKATREAVARGLQFLANHQAKDGHWSLNAFDKDARKAINKADGGVSYIFEKDNSLPGTSRQNDVAATAFALLPFLAAGHTHKPNIGFQLDYSSTVKAGLDYLNRNQNRDGCYNDTLNGGDMYSHALATLAMCEAFGLTADNKLKVSAQRAVFYIEFAQGAGGGWRYGPKANPGDNDVTGWQIRALASGQRAGLTVKDVTLKRAEIFLNSTESTSKGGYAYVPNGGETPTMTAVGLLDRLLLGANTTNPDLWKSVNRLEANSPSKNRNIYYLYFATVAMHQLNGDSWKKWNLGPNSDGKDGVRDILLSMMDKGTTNPDTAGSWMLPGEMGGGRLMSTSMALLTLEIYNRNLSLYRRQLGPGKGPK